MLSRAPASPDEIAQRVEGGDERALARLLSALEDGGAWASEALRLLRRGSSRARPAMVVGVTGPPGSGKSSLVDRLIAAYRDQGERVGVLAVDPSSPFSGGAILGDRIRMQGRSCDPGVFIRSLASRGRLGGLSRSAAQAARALEAAGYGVVLIETVGIGQSEVDVAKVADLVVLVSMPGSGDDIQAIKAGVMEIGDVFIVNKADREGADRMVREIRAMLEIGAAMRADPLSASARRAFAPPDSLVGHHAYAPQSVAPPETEGLPQGGYVPPVLKTIAATGEGTIELVEAIGTRWATLKASGELEARRERGAAAEARSLLEERVVRELEALACAGEGSLEDELAAAIVRGELEAAQAADKLFDAIARKGEKR